LKGKHLHIEAMNLYDFSGKLVANLAENGSIKNQLTIDMQHLPDGIYFLKTTTDKETLVKKVLMSR